MGRCGRVYFDVVRCIGVFESVLVLGIGYLLVSLWWDILMYGFGDKEV